MCQLNFDHTTKLIAYLFVFAQAGYRCIDRWLDDPQHAEEVTMLQKQQVCGRLPTDLDNNDSLLFYASCRTCRVQWSERFGSIITGEDWKKLFV